MRLRTAIGSALLGYGLLVVLGVLAHDAWVAGLVPLALGAAVLAWPSRTPRPDPAAPAPQPPAARRSLVLAGVGAGLALATSAYNGLARNGWSGPELALVAYGALLAGSATALDARIGRTSVASLVGWSFVLVLAPLALYAANAFITSQQHGATAATPVVHALIVVPSALLLRLVGTHVAVHGNTLLLPTGEGSLALGVGLVCAGIYPMVLFGSVALMHAWQTRLRPLATAALVGTGLFGLWLVDLVRITALAKVGQAWGPAALQETHANIGWVLFVLFMALFWTFALRWMPDRAAAATPTNT